MQPLAVLVLAMLAAAGPAVIRPQPPPAKPPTSATSGGTQQPATPQPVIAPARDARAAVAAPVGAVRGRVVSAETGEPLRHARVELSGQELKTTRAVPSDLDGRFEIQGVPPGRFTLRASKNGYVTLGYGQRRSFQAGRRIDLAAGQVFDEATIALPRAAVIAGRVLNDLGEPVQGIRVAAYRLRYVNGHRDVGAAGRAATTDDLGQYRVSGLPPGTYFVGTLGGIAATGSVAEEGLTLGTTYHPATANVAEGRPVTVRVAQEVRNIDIAMVASRAASVTGTVFDSRGRPAAGLAVSMRPAGDSVILAVLNTTSGSSQPNGQFAVRNLMPGEYVLHAVVRTVDSKEQESADVPLTVGLSDLEGINVQAMPNGRIVGRVVFDGDAKPTFGPGSLRLTAAAMWGRQPAFGQVGAGWDFEIRNIEPNRLTVSFDSLPAGWALKRILANGRDITESQFDLPAGDSPTTMELTLTDKPTSVSGVVARDAGAAASDDYTVVLFGDDPAQWRDGSRRVLVARPDQNGAYKLTGFPPGRYRAIAVEYLDDGEQWNPEFLNWARSRATVVEVGEGAAVALNLTLTKYAE